MMTNEKTLKRCGKAVMCRTTVHREGREPVRLVLPALETPEDAPWTLGIDAADADGAWREERTWASGCGNLRIVNDWQFPWAESNRESIPGDCRRPEIVEE